MKIVNKNIDIFCDFVCTSFSSSLKTLKLPGNIKRASVTTLFKKSKKDINGNYGNVKTVFLKRYHIF